MYRPTAGTARRTNPKVTMTDRTQAIAYAVAAAYTGQTTGEYLLTRTAAGRRAADLLNVAVSTARARIAEAITAGDLVEITPAADGSITLPGTELGATLYTRTGSAEGVVEVVLNIDARGTRAPRRPLLITPQDCQRLAQRLAARVAETAAADKVSAERIREALAAAGLRSASDHGDGFEVTWSADFVPMVLFLRGSQLRPPRNASPDTAREWERHLNSYRTALEIAGFEVVRRGYTVRVVGTTAPEGPEALAEFRAWVAEAGLGDADPAAVEPVVEERPTADVVRAAAEIPQPAQPEAEPVVEQSAAPAGRWQGTSTMRPARWLLLAAGVPDLDATAPAAPIAAAEQTVEQIEEPAAELVAKQPAELVPVSGAWYITAEQAATLGEQARTERQEFAADSERRRAAERAQFGPEREAAQLGAVEAARELLTAAGVADLDAEPTRNTGFRVSVAQRAGVWVRVRQTRGISIRRPDVRSAPWAARAWDANSETWDEVLRRAGWETSTPDEGGFYAAPPAAGVEPVVEDELDEDQEQPAPAPAPGAELVLYVDEPLPPAADALARAIVAAGRKSGVVREELLDPRELVGSVFADGLPFEATAPAAVAQLGRAGDVLAAHLLGERVAGGTEVLAAAGAVEEAAAALFATTRTATLGVWRHVAEYLANRDAERRTGTVGDLSRDGRALVEAVPALPALVDRAARLLAVWLTVRSLAYLKAADQAAREVAEALHAGTGAGRQTAWLQVARYAVEKEAAALIAARPAAELPAGTGTTGGAEQAVEATPARPALPAPAATQQDAATDLRERQLVERRAHDGLGDLPASVRVLDYDLESWEWGFECERHGGGWERQPGQWETRAEAEGAARLHAADHAAGFAALTVAEDEFDQAAALAFSAEQVKVLGEAHLGRLCEDARGFYFDNDGFDLPRPVQGRRVVDLWARGLVQICDGGAGRHQIITTAAGAAALDLWRRARRLGAVAPAEADTMRSNGRQRAAYPRIKPAPAPEGPVGEGEGEQRSAVAVVATTGTRVILWAGPGRR